MIGLDTNVLVRYIVRDDPTQAAAADQLVASLTAAEPGFVSPTALVELWWVLARSYKRSQAERCALFEALLDTDELTIGDRASAREALDAANKGADFADALLVAQGRTAGCVMTATFDKAAASRAGMTLIDTGP
ncbi:MAG: type II toxin-antitoxin system VapC family toxin [Propionibacteriaceae bacterium]|jgi:predicted nucleic-acid-binding protein|nr:type II toxin-antitoxin system VapC family toxin [Propionibacteriaceae bacterium]